MLLWTYIPLVGIGMLAFWLFVQIGKFFSRKKYVLRNYIYQEQDKSYESLLSNKYVRWAIPSYIVREANESGWILTYSKYFIYVATGALTGAVLMFCYFRSFTIMMIGSAILGFAFPYYQLQKKKRIMRDELQSKFIIYFKYFASYLRAFNFNLTRTLTELANSVDEPIKSEVEKVLYELRQGTPVDEAFEEFNRKFPVARLFHNLVQVVVKVGEDDKDLLSSAAKKFAKKRYWQNKLQTANKKYLIDTHLIIGLTLCFPIFYMFMSYEYYMSFVQSLLGRITLFLLLIIMVIRFINVQKDMVYDPTER